MASEVHRELHTEDAVDVAIVFDELGLEEAPPTDQVSRIALAQGSEVELRFPGASLSQDLHTWASEVRFRLSGRRDPWDIAKMRSEMLTARQWRKHPSPNFS